MTTATATESRLVLGYAAALGAAFCYGAAAVIAGKIVDDYSSPMVGAAFSMLFGALIVAVIFRKTAFAEIATAPRRALGLMVLAGVAATWGVSFWFLALDNAPVVLVAPLSGTHPLWSILLAHLFLQRIERVTWRTLLGTLMLVAGVALIAVGRD